MPRTVDVYFSLVSPWAYLGHDPFLELKAKHKFEVRWKPVQLGPLFAETGGVPLAKRAIQRQRYRIVELQRWAEKRGRPLKLQPAHWPFDPKLADGAVLAILAAGGDPTGFIGGAFRAVWEKDRDLGSRTAVSFLLASSGFETPDILDAAESAATAAAYEQNRADAMAADVFGSPSYVLDGEVFWGQDRLDLLDDALASGRPPFTADV